jgi:hypothetical protein
MHFMILNRLCGVLSRKCSERFIVETVVTSSPMVRANALRWKSSPLPGCFGIQMWEELDMEKSNAGEIYEQSRLSLSSSSKVSIRPW